MKKLLALLLLAAALFSGASQSLAAVSKLTVLNLAGTQAAESTYTGREGAPLTFGYQVKLPTKPSGPVVASVTVTGTAPLEIVEGAALTFTVDNFSTLQKVRFKEGAIKTGQTAAITFAAAGYGSFVVNYSVGKLTVVTNGQLKPVEQIKAEDLPGAHINLQQALPRAIGWFLTIIALAAFLSLLYSGFLYITAGGDSGKAESARKNIIWALTGIIIALLSYSAVHFVSNWQLGSSGGSGTGTGGNTSGTTDNGSLLVTTGLADTKLTERVITDPAEVINAPVLLRLAAKPAAAAILTVSSEGTLPLALSSDTFTFTPDNWDKSQLLTIIYSGNGQKGDGSRLVFRLNGQLAYSVPWSIPAAVAQVPPVYVADDHMSELTEIELRSGTAMSIELRLLMESEPTASLTVGLASTGAVPLTLSPDSITFTPDDWSLSQTFGLSYDGSGQAGQTATLNLTVNNQVVHSVNVTLL